MCAFLIKCWYWQVVTEGFIVFDSLWRKLKSTVCKNPRPPVQVRVLQAPRVLLILRNYAVVYLLTETKWAMAAFVQMP